MSFDLTWEIGTLMTAYAEKIQPLITEKFDYDKYEQREALEKLYAQAIELTCRDNCGLIMPINMCIDWVHSGGINDYDGMGYLLDKDGKEIDSMCCSVSFLQEAKGKGAYFVAWYNK